MKLRILAEYVLGWLLVIGGVLVTPLPIPTGILMIALGLGVLARRSRSVRRLIRSLRGRFPRISLKLQGLEPRLGKGLSKVLRATDPLRGRRGTAKARAAIKASDAPDQRTR